MLRRGVHVLAVCTHYRKNDLKKKKSRIANSGIASDWPALTEGECRDWSLGCSGEIHGGCGVLMLCVGDKGREREREEQDGKEKEEGKERD